MKAAAIILAASLAGCATQPKFEPYHPEHADPARFKRDVSECEYESVKATASYAPDSGGMRTEIGAAISRGLAMRDRRIEVAFACMRARGYQFRPIGSTDAFR